MGSVRGDTSVTSISGVSDHGNPAVTLGERRDAGACGQLVTAEKLQAVAVLGPARSGKSVSVLLPALLSWSGSALVVDVAGELWEASAGYRSHAGHDIYRFDPDSPGCVHMNPLEWINTTGPSGAEDCAGLAARLLAKATTVPSAFAQAEFPGKLLPATQGLLAALLRQECARLGTLPGLARRSATPLAELCRQLLEIAVVDPAAADAARAVLGCSSAQQRAVRVMLQQGLEIFREPQFDRVMDRNDLPLSALTFGEASVTVYLTLRAARWNQIEGLLGFIVNHCLRNAARAFERAPGRALLLLSDHFPELGKMPAFLDLAPCVHAGIQVVWATHSIDALKDIYGKDFERLISQVQLWAVTGASDLTEARWVSQLTAGGVSPEEVLRLEPPKVRPPSAGDMLVWGPGGKLVRARQRPFFLDTTLRDRSRHRPRTQG